MSTMLSNMDGRTPDEIADDAVAAIAEYFGQFEARTASRITTAWDHDCEAPVVAMYGEEDDEWADHDDEDLVLVYVTCGSRQSHIHVRGLLPGEVERRVWVALDPEYAGDSDERPGGFDA